ncbi:MAG: hypothetical protein ACI8P3_000674 [Saprospiraceae bacterium]|jgi:hypothetical protein
MNQHTSKTNSRIFSSCITFILLSLISSSLFGQSHTFPVFDPGTISSNDNGVETNLPTTGLTDNFFVYVIEADYEGIGGAQTAWSCTMNVELNDGATIYKPISHADAGAKCDPNLTTLKWSGVMNHLYVGGDNLNIRFFDDFDDMDGPYTSSITNVKVTIYIASSQHEFSSFSISNLTSGTDGITTALPTASISGNYLVYIVTADFEGTGGAQTAWSSSIQMELKDSDGGSTIFEALADPNSGEMNNADPATLKWSGILTREYIGGDDLAIRFFDDFHDMDGPYLANINNIKVEIFEAVDPTDLPVINPGTVTSGTSGVTTALTTSGASGDFLFYVINADFVGTGGAQTAWSNSIEMELNNGAGILYKDSSKADLGAQENPDQTTLTWAGVLNEKYVGGTDLSILFFDNFHDMDGPYTSNITNVRVRLYEPEDVAVPVESVNFEAKDVTIFPNPGSSVFNFHLSEQFDNSFHQIVIYDSLGKMIKSTIRDGDRFALDLSAYANGIYFISINSGAWYKLIKQ